jgi:acetyl esterase
MQIILEKNTARFIEELLAKGLPPIQQLSYEEARKAYDQAQNIPVPKPAVSIEDHILPCGPNGQVSIRIIRPPDAKGPLPVALFFHGGGWIIGNQNTHDRIAREIACGSEAAVIFVNYSLAPEAKYPTQNEEAYAVAKYIAERGGEMNLDPSHMAVVGDSAGGNMAAVVALLAKERRGPKIKYQALLYPVTDAKFNTHSYEIFQDGPGLTRAAMQWFWDAYAPDHNARHKASPLQTPLKDLHDLPPALVITAENDVLRDEGEAYASKLMQAGVEVTAVRYMGTIHGFAANNALRETPAAKSATALVAAKLHDALFSMKQKRGKVA